MNEPLLLGLIIIVAITAVVIASRAPVERRARSLARLESKIDALLKHQGVTFDPYANLPAPVVDALRRGRKMEAIKEYRLATGVGLLEAKERVEDAQRAS